MTVAKEYLDFEILKNDLEQIIKRNAGKDVLNDLTEIPRETLDFLTCLLNATNTSQLAKYSDALMDEGMELLYSSEKVLNYISNYLEDATILGDKANLQKEIKYRHLPTRRRLL